jgi:hypothetical protein
MLNDMFRSQNTPRVSKRDKRSAPEELPVEHDRHCKIANGSTEFVLNLFRNIPVLDKEFIFLINALSLAYLRYHQRFWFAGILSRTLAINPAGKLVAVLFTGLRLQSLRRVRCTAPNPWCQRRA